MSATDPAGDAASRPVNGTIASLQNPRVKAAVRLRDRPERDATGLTIVDGGRELTRAIAAGVDIVEAFVCEELIRTDDVLAAARELDAMSARVWRVPVPVLEKVAFGERSEGIVALVRIPSLALADLAPPPDPLIAVVENIEKPGNLGAILRSADGAGLDALIAADPRTDLFNPNAIQASLGTIFSVPLAAATTSETLSWLRRRGIRTVAARVDGARVYTEADLRGPLAIALGSEAGGLSDAWRAADVEAVRLPMFGVGDSLNVSVAAAVLFYEARRQRGLPPGHNSA